MSSLAYVENHLMLKERAKVVFAGLLIVDLALVAVAFFASFWLRNHLIPAMGLRPLRLYPLEQYLPILPISLLIWGALLLRFNLYHSQRTASLLRETGDIARVSLAGTLLLALAIYLLRLDRVLLANDEISRLWILLFVSLGFLLITARAVAVRLVARWVRARGYNYRTILIAGANQTARKIATTIGDHPYWGYRVLGFVTESDDDPIGPIDPSLILGRVDEIGDIVETRVVDEVIFALIHGDPRQLENTLLQLEEQGIPARFALDLFPHAKAQVQVDTLEKLPLLSYSTAPSNELHLLVKRVIDIGISLVVLSLALPVMLGIAAVIKLAQGGNVLYRQTRCGLNGRRFTLLKFRTMIEGAEHQQQDLHHLNEMNGPVFKMRRDPRVTGIGRWLRRFSLDELPQLWNVLRGDMSLVGPRPPVPDEVSSYQRWQRRRLSMRPGLTCLWQIEGRNEVDFDRWMELDLEYIDNWSPLLDIKILARTIPVVLSGRGAS